MTINLETAVALGVIWLATAAVLFVFYREPIS